MIHWIHETFHSKATTDSWGFEVLEQHEWDGDPLATIFTQPVERHYNHNQIHWHEQPIRRRQPRRDVPGGFRKVEKDLNAADLSDDD